MTLVNIEIIADKLGVKKSLVEKWIKGGIMEAIKQDGGHYIAAADTRVSGTVSASFVLTVDVENPPARATKKAVMM
ncbi:MAG: hypothetical protein BWY90_00113 [Deltaproteobacteria bacterium ADurb.BinA014]|nr:MAG: hypothetical protein BWY90_00113 [Deltaproteobacteria bacterium ADurb.BinA014]